MFNLIDSNIIKLEDLDGLNGDRKSFYLFLLDSMLKKHGNYLNIIRTLYSLYFSEPEVYLTRLDSFNLLKIKHQDLNFDNFEIIFNDFSCLFLKKSKEENFFEIFHRDFIEWFNEDLYPLTRELVFDINEAYELRKIDLSTKFEHKIPRTSTPICSLKCTDLNFINSQQNISMQTTISDSTITLSNPRIQTTIEIPGNKNNQSNLEPKNSAHEPSTNSTNRPKRKFCFFKFFLCF